MTTTNANQALATTAIVSVTTRKPSARRKAREGTTRVVGAAGDDPDADSTSVSVELLRSQEYLDLTNGDNQMRAWMKAASLPAGRHIAAGCYLVPLASVERVLAYLREREAVREEQVDAFIRAYPDAVRDAHERLRDAFVPAMFPGCEMVDGQPYVSRAGAEMIRSAFTMTYGLEVADREAGIRAASGALSPAFIQRELEKARETGAAMLQDIRDGLRVAFAELVDNAAAALKPAEDGQRKAFRADHLLKIQSFLASFEERNIAGDGDLSRVLATARDVLAGITPESLKDARDVEPRDRMRKALDVIATEMAPIIAPRRKISLAEADAVPA